MVRKNKDSFDDKKLLDELSSLKKSSSGNTDIKAISKLDTKQDLTKKKVSPLNKIYPYWVMIMKDGKRLNSFGVREETIDGIKLLVRRERIGSEDKVIFRELYPEPKFDLNIIQNNRNQIKKELNKLNQIEDELNQAFYDKKDIKEYNYDISGVRLKQLQREIELNAIKYGKTFRYFLDLRDDGIPVLIYELENGGLKLKKEVKERQLFTEASESKKIESVEVGRQIDKQLSKKDDKDWRKLAGMFIFVLFTIANMFAFFEWITFNEERSFEQCDARLSDLLNTQAVGLNKINDAIIKNSNNEAITSILSVNNDILSKCVDPSINYFAKPVAE